jgi:hypothetical protein
LCHGTVFGQIKRSRAEGMPDVAASNTIGFGNIWLRSHMSFSARSNEELFVEPYLAAGLGLSHNMSLFVGAVPFEGGFKQVIGKGDVHLKLTLPFNDNLRFLGVAVQGDMVFSTEQDTTSVGQSSDRPAFTPRPGVTVMCDIDLIKLIKALPFKLYVNASLIDNDRLLARYSQVSLRGGLEYKGPRHSIFIGGRYGLYKKLSRNREESERARFDRKVIYVTPGVRYRLFSRFSVVGSARFPVLTNIPDTSTTLYYEKFGIRLGLEFPLFFRETNTEAIRGMIFLERRKAVAAGPKPKTETDNLSALLRVKMSEQENKEFMKMIKEEDAKFESEKNLKEKRKKIYKELKEIMEMLE